MRSIKVVAMSIIWHELPQHLYQVLRRPVDPQVTQQVRVDHVRLVRRRRFRLAVDGRQTHEPHQAADPLTARVVAHTTASIDTARRSDA